MGNTMNEYLSIAELSLLANLRPSMIRSLVFKRKIPYLKVGRLLRFDKKDILRWLEEKKVAK